LKVLLIVPQSRLPIETRTTPPLGIAYIGAVAQGRGDEVRLIDLNVDETPLQTFVKWGPDIVGITANTSQIKAAWNAAAELRTLGSKATIVLGGVHPTVLPEESLEKPQIDIIVHGEGEYTWLELSQILSGRLADGQTGLPPETLSHVQGISYKNADGRPIHTPGRPPIPASELDHLPFPAYNLFQLDRYSNLQPTLDVRGQRGKSFAIMTSRGCPYRCTFCSQSIFPERWRGRSPENVVAEWRHLIQDLGATEIGVLDDSFNIDVRRVRRICELLIAEKLNLIPWIMINGIRANLADEETLRLMRRAGCIRTAFGVESGDQVILNSIDKHLELEVVKQAFRTARKVGLETIGFFMIGLPGDTEESINRTIALACELDPVVANFSMTTPFPGTVLWEQVHTGGGRLLIEDWDEFVFFEGKARYELGPLTAELMERKWREAYQRFYLRPHRILGTLLRKSTWSDPARIVRMALRLVTPRHLMPRRLRVGMQLSQW